MPLKTGLVLEGGAMRGMYTAGVLDVFLEKGIAFDGVVGVSAGAIVGCSVIRPEPPLEIGRMSHDPEEIQKAYRRGREDAVKKLSAMNRWLEREKDS